MLAYSCTNGIVSRINSVKFLPSPSHQGLAGSLEQVVVSSRRRERWRGTKRAE